MTTRARTAELSFALLDASLTARLAVQLYDHDRAQLALRDCAQLVQQLDEQLHHARQATP